MCAEAASTTAAQAHSGCNGMPTKPAPQKVTQLFKKPEVRTINATQTCSDAAAFSLRFFLFSAKKWRIKREGSGNPFSGQSKNYVRVGRNVKLMP